MPHIIIDKPLVIKSYEWVPAVKAKTYIIDKKAFTTLYTELNRYLSNTRDVEALSKNIEIMTYKINKIIEKIKNIKTDDDVGFLNKLEKEKQVCIYTRASYTNARLTKMKEQEQSYIAYLNAFNVWDNI